MANQIIASNQLNRRSFLWNIIGSGLGAGSSFFLLLCVTRIVGTEEGGIFSLAYANAQLCLTVGKFGIRSYQSTDISKKISATVYMVSRMITCIAMAMLCLVSIVIFRYDFRKASIVFAVCVIKLSDAVEDVYHGQLQLNNKLDVAGKLLAFRNIFTMFLFATLIYVTKDLLPTCWFTGIFSLVICIFVNHGITVKYEIIKFCWKNQELKLLFIACFPLFLGTFLSLYIYNAPKYAIDIFCSPEMQTYYAIIFMPAFVINMFSEFIFRPLLTTLATWWNRQEGNLFYKLVIRLIGVIILITIPSVVFMYFAGPVLLSFVYGVNVAQYRTELVLLMLGGGCGAIVYFLYNVLTAMRKQREILIAYLAGAILVTLLAFFSIKKYGLTAAAASYVTVEVFMGLMMGRWIYKSKKLFATRCEEKKERCGNP